VRDLLAVQSLGQLQVMSFRIVADKDLDLPEGLRQHAKLVDGKFVVDALPEGWEVGDTIGLRKTLSEERTMRKTAEKALQAYEGIDDAAAAREALTQMKAGSLKSAKEIEEFRKSLETKVAADIAKKDAMAHGLTKQLTELMVDNAAQKAIAEAGGNLKLLLPIVKAAVKAETTADGRLAVAVVDDSGKELVSKVAGATSPMSIAEYVNTLREQTEFKVAFAGSGTGGSSATHSAASAARATVPGSASARELFTRAANVTI